MRFRIGCAVHPLTTVIPAGEQVHVVSLGDEEYEIDLADMWCPGSSEEHELFVELVHEV